MGSALRCLGAGLERCAFGRCPSGGARFFARSCTILVAAWGGGGAHLPIATLRRCLLLLSDVRAFRGSRRVLGVVVRQGSCVWTSYRVYVHRAAFWSIEPHSHERCRCAHTCSRVCLGDDIDDFCVLRGVCVGISIPLLILIPAHSCPGGVSK
jgi:hypothetical protein